MAKNEKSVTDLVCEHIKKQKLLPIPVQTLNEEAEATRYFGGDLKEFLAAAKTLGAKGIFVETLYLEDDEFYNDRDRKSTRLNSSHIATSRMPSSA